MSRTVLAFLLIACLAAPVDAFDEPAARTRMAGECVECAAYYDVIANCLEATRPLDKELAERYRSISRKLANQAGDWSGANATQAVDDAEAEMVRGIKQDCNALAPLKERHKEICKGLVEKPKARLNYWLEQQQ